MATTKLKIGVKSRGTYAETNDTLNLPYVRTDSGKTYTLLADGYLNAEKSGIYTTVNTDANVTALNAVLAKNDVTEIVFDNPKGGDYIITGGVPVTVPYGKKLTFRNGSKLVGTGKVVFEECIPEAGKFQIFGDDLEVRFNAGRNSQFTIFPEWWGAKSMWQMERCLTLADLPTYGNIDSSAAFQKMFNSLYGYSFYSAPGEVPAIISLSGWYAISQQININFFYGKIKGNSMAGRSGAGFRWMLHDANNKDKVMFKMHGCEFMEWWDVCIWGYRDDNPDFRLKSVFFPVCDSTITPVKTQRRHQYNNVMIGDATGLIGNASTEEQSITAFHFAKAGVLTMGSEPGSIYINGNNDFFMFHNCQFYNVDIGVHNRQNQAVEWVFNHCQGGVINYMFQFDYGGGVTVRELFLEGYAVENGFINLIGGTDYYFFGQFTKVSMEDIKGEHFIKASTAFDLIFQDIGISFYRNIGDTRPVFLIQADTLGSNSSVCFEAGSFNGIRGFYGQPVDPNAFMQVALDSDIQTVFNVSFEKKVEGTGFKGLKFKQPIGNSIINISLDAFERFGFDSVNDTGTRYTFKKIERKLISTDPMWINYPSGFIPIRDFMKDRNSRDEFQQASKRWVLGEIGRQPGFVTGNDAYQYITDSTDNIIILPDVLPANITILGVGFSQQESIFPFPFPDRTNSSAYVMIGDQYDRARWGMKPVGANFGNNQTVRRQVNLLSPVVYDNPSDLHLTAVTQFPMCTLVGGVLITANPWFVPADNGQVIEFFDGELAGLKMTVTSYVDSTHLNVNVSDFSTAVPANCVQLINWVENKAIIISIYTEEGNYNEMIPGGRYVWYLDLPSLNS